MSPETPNISGNSATVISQHVPITYPILKSAIDLKEDRQLFQISPEHVIRLCTHLKNHLNTCAFNVTKDQEAITTEIQNVRLLLIKSVPLIKGGCLHNIEVLYHNE